MHFFIDLLAFNHIFEYWAVIPILLKGNKYFVHRYIPYVQMMAILKKNSTKELLNSNDFVNRFFSDIAECYKSQKSRMYGSSCGWAIVNPFHCPSIVASRLVLTALQLDLAALGLLVHGISGLEFQRESESPRSQRLPQMNPQESS